MRTTVTLEPDVAESLRAYVHESRTTFKVALNTLLRRGLAAGEPPGARRRKFVVEPHSGKFKAGVDLAKLNQLVDQLDVEEFLKKASVKR